MHYHAVEYSIDPEGDNNGWRVECNRLFYNQAEAVELLHTLAHQLQVEGTLATRKHVGIFPCSLLHLEEENFEA